MAAVHTSDLVAQRANRDLAKLVAAQAWSAAPYRVPSPRPTLPPRLAMGASSAGKTRCVATKPVERCCLPMAVWNSSEPYQIPELHLEVTLDVYAGKHFVLVAQFYAAGYFLAASAWIDGANI